MKRNGKKLSKISALHYHKLFFRSTLLIAALIIYIVDRERFSSGLLGKTVEAPFIFAVIGIVFAAEMILRFFPSSLESMGCQKQFKRNYIETGESVPTSRTPLRTLAVAGAWLLLNGIIGALYFLGIIDAGMLILISLAYSVCDMICILYFCPFQTWFLKNKCCGSCRIYNWDYAMMFTPLVFIPSAYTYSLLGIAVLLLIVWEIHIIIHPKRFFEQTNACLSCANCKEKLCHHKKQLRSFLRANKELLILKGNTVVEKAKKKIEEIKNNTKGGKR